MKKRIFALALVLVMALGLMIPVTAFEDHNYLYVAVSDMDDQRLIDQGETTLPTLSDQYGCSLRVDIVDGTEAIPWRATPSSSMTSTATATTMTETEPC